MLDGSGSRPGGRRVSGGLGGLDVAVGEEDPPLLAMAAGTAEHASGEECRRQCRHHQVMTASTRDPTGCLRSCAEASVPCVPVVQTYPSEHVRTPTKGVVGPFFALPVDVWLAPPAGFEPA